MFVNSLNPAADGFLIDETFLKVTGESRILPKKPVFTVKGSELMWDDVFRVQRNENLGD